MQLGFVFTNYNNSQVTDDAIRSIVNNNDIDNIIIAIVDNNSNKDNVNRLKAIKNQFLNIHLILNKTNVGYFKGLNIGIKYIKKNFGNINHLVIGNNDLVFSIDFIDSVKKKYNLFKKYPVISPNIITLDGIHQNPHVVEKISKPRQLIHDLYYSNFYLALIIEKISKITHSFTDRSDEKQFKIPQEIYQGYGACYILGPVFFQNFEKLWAPSFIMHEEFFLAEQLYSKGYKTFYEPSIKVSHNCHSTTKVLLKKRRWELSRDAHRLCKQFLQGKKLELL